MASNWLEFIFVMIYQELHSSFTGTRTKRTARSSSTLSFCHVKVDISCLVNFEKILELHTSYSFVSFDFIPEKYVCIRNRTWQLCCGVGGGGMEFLTNRTEVNRLLIIIRDRRGRRTDRVKRYIYFIVHIKTVLGAHIRVGRACERRAGTFFLFVMFFYIFFLNVYIFFLLFVILLLFFSDNGGEKTNSITHGAVAFNRFP